VTSEELEAFYCIEALRLDPLLLAAQVLFFILFFSFFSFFVSNARLSSRKAG